VAEPGDHYSLLINLASVGVCVFGQHSAC
jgi:hypothetical protein